MFWLILGCTIPSMIVCWAAGFAVRRWGPRFGLVDRPGHRKIHETPLPTSGGLAIWLGIVLPLLVGQIVLWGLSESPPTGIAASAHNAICPTSSGSTMPSQMANPPLVGMGVS